MVVDCCWDFLLLFFICFFLERIHQNNCLCSQFVLQKAVEVMLKAKNISNVQFSNSECYFLSPGENVIKRKKKKNNPNMPWSFFSLSLPVWKLSFRYPGIHEFRSAGLHLWLPFRTFCQMERTNRNGRRKKYFVIKWPDLNTKDKQFRLEYNGTYLCSYFKCLISLFFLFMIVLMSKSTMRGAQKKWRQKGWITMKSAG